MHNIARIATAAVRGNLYASCLGTQQPGGPSTLGMNLYTNGYTVLGGAVVEAFFGEPRGRSGLRVDNPSLGVVLSEGRPIILRESSRSPPHFIYISR